MWMRLVKKSGQNLTGWFEPDVAEADGIEVILKFDSPRLNQVLKLQEVPAEA
jgi:hypothetical protein